MMKNKFLVFLGVLLLVSCDITDATKTGNNSDENNPGTVVTHEASPNALTNNDSVSVGTPEGKKRQDAPTENNEVLSVSFMLSYLPLGFSILSLFMVVYLGFNILRIRNRLESESFKDYIIDRVIMDSYKNKGRIFNLINGQVQKSNYQSLVSESNLESLVKKSIDKNIDVIVDRVLVCIQLNKKEEGAILDTQSDNISTPPQSNISYLYASSADRDRNTFFKITPQPDEDTIYQLTVSGERSKFSIYEGAFSKVLKAPDFLECACEVQKTGSQRVTTKGYGTAEKQADGAWRITSKATIKFE